MARGLPLLVGLVLWLVAVGLVSTRRLANQEESGAADDLFAQQRARGYRKVKKTHQSLLPPRKPNIVLILTDDQDVELGSLNFMPRTLRLLKDEGAEFRHAYVTTPMCCPSRSSLLTGMYVHNHQVFTNNDNCSSAQWQAEHETRSFATYLSNAGYRTGYFGKYLNKYNGSYIPPGWREWGGLIMNSRYYNYSINMNGKKIKHGADYHKDYYPDLIANDSVAFLRQSKHLARSKPVMLVVSFPAPHGPEDSAPQFSHLFFNVTTHHTPAYDYAPNPDKQWILQVTQRMQPIHRHFTDLLMTKRLQTLQSVDDAVEKIYKELDSLGELDNTYILYTSDHGYHLGQFGLVKGKSFPFEFDVRVPFLVRGPGIEPGIVVDEIVLNLDVAPTLLDIAGVETPPHMDGRSMLPLLDRRVAARRKKSRWPDTFLIESSGRRETPESGSEGRSRLSSRGQHHNKVDTDGATRTSVFNHTNMETPSTDYPDNMANMFPINMSTLDKIPVLARPDLQDDNQVVPIVLSSLSNKVERLALECQKPELQTPCEPGQKWHCVHQGNRWRKHKCKFQSPIVGGLMYGGSRRRCACYTPTGVMYTRLQPEERRMQRQFLRGHVNKDIREYRPKFLRTVRTKRSAGEEEILDALSRRLGKIERKSKRKRDTLQQVSSIMEDIEEEIHGLQASREEEDVDGDEDGDDQLEPTSVAGGCQVLPSGGVNCSNAIYQDPRAWRSSRRNIDEEIQKLRQQLDTLKEIRRHLHAKRPLTSYDVSHEDEDVPTEEDTVDDLEDSGPSPSHPPPRRRKPSTTSSPHPSTTQPVRRRQKNNTHPQPSTTEDTQQGVDEEKEQRPRDHRRRQKHRPHSTASVPVSVDLTTPPGAEENVPTSPASDNRQQRRPFPSATLQNVTNDSGEDGEDSAGSKNVDRETKDTHLDVGSVGPRQNRRKHKHRNSTTPRSVMEESSTRALEAVTKEQGHTFEASHNVEHDTVEGNLDSNEDVEDDDDDDDVDNDEDEEEEDEDVEEEYNKFDETLFEDYEERQISTTEGHHRHQHHLVTTARARSPLEESTADPREQSTAAPNTIDNRAPARIDVTVFGPPENANRRPPFLLPDTHEQHMCYCETDEALARREEKEAAKEARRRLKEERLRKKERKQRRKAKLEKECLSERMNCFTHDNSHWKTEPFWTEGPFCFCMNANNNTYSCVRTINATHNFLYCEFVTGLITFYNLRIDPFEQWNRVHSLTSEELSYLRDQLRVLKECKGSQQCTVGSATQPLPTHPYTQTAKFNKKKYALIDPGGGGKPGRASGANVRGEDGTASSTSNAGRNTPNKP